jgi:hypothetical protein
MAITPTLASIVTPSFNQPGHPASRLDRVAMQGYPWLEHVVGGGRFRDGSDSHFFWRLRAGVCRESAANAERTRL